MTPASKESRPATRTATVLASTSLSLMISCSTLQEGLDYEVATKVARVPKGKVVLVPGIFDTRFTMRPLRKAIVAGGYECLMPSLKPVDGRKGLEPLARQLRDVIDQEIAPGEKVSIVAFSMGGLVARYYLQQLGGAKHCLGLYTIATPHHGSYVAYLYPGRGTRQMRPDSRFLAALRENDAIYDEIPVTSYRNPLDVVMLPTKSPKWERAENVRFFSAMHSSLMWEKDLHMDLLQRLAKNAARREQPLPAGPPARTLP